MRKSFLVTVLAFLTLLLSNYSNAQSLLSLQIGPTAGVTVPTGDYSGTVNDFYNGTKYGMSTGANFGALAKINTPIISGKAFVAYTMLSSSDNLTVGGSMETKHHIVTFGIGPEYKLGLPMIPFRPYFDAMLLVSSVSGSLTTKSIPQLPSNTYDFDTETRTGLSVGVGSEFTLSPQFNLDINVRYNIFNMIGKKFNQGQYQKIDSYNSLNDDADPLSAVSTDHPVKSSRNMSAIQISVSVLFGLGI
jgi:opacity protein-like surface antigen